MSNLQITFWGGVGTVTGANFLLESPNSKILIDCGLLQGAADSEEENKKPFPYDPKIVNYLFVTHAHTDHIGRIPKLVREGFRGTIYSTTETRELSELMIADALKIMNQLDFQTPSEHVTSSPTPGVKPAPLYEQKDADMAFSLWKTISYDTKTQINEEFSVNLKDAGHILGAAMYEFTYADRTRNERRQTQTDKPIKIVFSGDSGNSPSPLLKDTEPITDADYLIIDSVYGDRVHEPKEERDERFKQIILDTIEKGGALVVPAFSIERTQVILYELNNLIEKSKIPSVPVFLDSPLAEKVTEVYARFSKDFNFTVQDEIKSGDNIFNFPKLSITHSSRGSMDIVNTPNPKIIIAGSGMSSGGRVVGHEIKYLPDPKSTILLMGYQALGTLGRMIQDKPAQADINRRIVPVRARIEMISGYSSHKDSDALVKMVADTEKTVRKVFVVMGEPKSSMFLAQRLRDELGVQAIYPERGKTYELQ
ncbi:MAG: MBL fold metallo-hydrolase [Candidatus Zambryskibacteria bacterium]|nr:MBL fold metallo-hydrolase [Candidatus Zambryskibacteria bacterium]